MAKKSDIPAAYIHPSTKQCNYSVDPSSFVSVNSSGVRQCILLSTITVTTPSFNLKPYLKDWATIVLQPISGYVVQSTYSDYNYYPAIITESVDSTYCAGPSVVGNNGNMTIYFQTNGITLESLNMLHSFDINLDEYYIYSWTISQGNYIKSSNLMFGTSRNGSGNRVAQAISCNVKLNIYGVST